MMRKLLPVAGALVLWTLLGVMLPVQAAQPSARPKSARARAGQKALTPAQAWALATSAVLWERNQDRHDTLGGNEPSPQNIAQVKNTLREWWGITDRESLLASLEWLGNGGHREEFEEIGAFLGSLDEQQYNEVLAEARRDAEVYHRIQIVRRYYRALGRKSLLGWDYARYVSLCRWGYFVGYISEEEAWERIMPAARLLQESFESWKDLGENYLIGREFWSLAQTKRNGQLYRDALRRLLRDPRGPWIQYPWDLDLGAANQVPPPAPGMGR